MFDRSTPSAAPPADRPTVVVVGAGFSGLLTAVRLLAAPDGPVVRLVERRSRFGRGAAYSTASPEHLLNVRAANMSAFLEWPSHFAEWLEARGIDVGPQTYVTRSTYGEYLQEVLDQAVAMSASTDRLILETEEVTALTREGGRSRLHTAGGKTFEADAVVLALGNLPPHPPLQVDPAVERAGRYVPDPWAWKASRAPRRGLAVLFGTGLTMVDVALSLSADRPDLRLMALSRRGLLPRRHLEAAPALEGGPGPGLSALEMLRRLRVQATGADWRPVMDGLRPQVQSIWRAWPQEQRRRFLRHARPWWDVHRHRLAPAVAERLDHLTASGALRVVAGRALGLVPGPDGDRLAWRPRGVREVTHTDVVLAVNCTGPAGDLAASGDALPASLHREGLIRPDACSLGVDVDSRSRVIGADGRPDPALFAVGPITRGAFWEITSVPDIRIQAADCAAQVLESLAAARRPRAASRRPPRDDVLAAARPDV